jgi:putative oxidoreductase
MSIVRRIARPLLAAQFIAGGVDQLLKPDAKAAAGGPVIPMFAGAQLGPVTLPTEPRSLVRLNGGIMAGAGALLTLGRLPRLSAFTLAASLVPTTVTGHRFWEEKDVDARKAQRIQFLKNLGLFGGLLIAAVDTDGKPGLGWRAQRAKRDATRSAKLAKNLAKRDAKVAGKAVRVSGKTLRREAKLVAARAGDKLPG